MCALNGSRAGSCKREDEVDEMIIKQEMENYEGLPCNQAECTWPSGELGELGEEDAARERR